MSCSVFLAMCFQCSFDKISWNNFWNVISSVKKKLQKKVWCVLGPRTHGKGTVCRVPWILAHGKQCLCRVSWAQAHGKQFSANFFLTELITFEKLFHNILSNEHWKHISKDTEQLMVYDSNQKILLFHAFQIV